MSIADDDIVTIRANDIFNIEYGISRLISIISYHTRIQIDVNGFSGIAVVNSVTKTISAIKDIGTFRTNQSIVATASFEIFDVAGGGEVSLGQFDIVLVVPEPASAALLAALAPLALRRRRG